MIRSPKARRALERSRTDEMIRKAVETAPPLDAETAARLRSLIPPLPNEEEVGGGIAPSEESEPADPTVPAPARRSGDEPENVQRRVDALAEHIRKAVDALPPLTEAQRAKLAALLRPTGGADPSREDGGA